MKVQNQLKIGDVAPHFQTVSTFGAMKLSDYRGKWLVLFSHPSDFTPVGTTEILAFAQQYESFRLMGCELVGLSTDSNASHLAWVYHVYQKTKVEIPFPIIDDNGGEIAQMYGMVGEREGKRCILNNVYMINPEGIICALISYPMHIGRSVDEIIRLLRALQLTQDGQIFTPANWERDVYALKPPPATFEELKGHIKNPEDLCCMDWYLCFCDPEGAQKRT